MLRFKEGVTPKYTKREYRIIEEKQRIESSMNDAYEKINNLVYKLREEYRPVYKYEKIIFFKEVIDGYEISAFKFPEFIRYLVVLTDNNLPDSEICKIFYNDNLYKIPRSEVAKVKDLCEKLDKLFAETDYKIDDMSDIPYENNEDLYQERHSR